MLFLTEMNGGGSKGDGQQLPGLQDDSLLAPIGTETRAKVKRTEERLSRERNEARRECERMATELRRLRQQAAQAWEQQQEERAARLGTDGSSDDDVESPRTRRSMTKNLIQQAASLAPFDGDDLKEDAITISNWFDKFDTLARLYRWSSQECLVALVGKLKRVALSVYLLLFFSCLLRREEYRLIRNRRWNRQKYSSQMVKQAERIGETANHQGTG